MSGTNAKVLSRVLILRYSRRDSLSQRTVMLASWTSCRLLEKERGNDSYPCKQELQTELRNLGGIWDHLLNLLGWIYVFMKKWLKSKLLELEVFMM